MLVKNVASKLWIDALIKSEKNETKIERAKHINDKGYLKKLIVGVGTISAIFQVPNEAPVKSEITLKPLPDIQISKLETIFKKNPIFVSELLNGLISQSFLNEVEEYKIRLIPQSWREIESNCSSDEKNQPSRYVIALIQAFGKKIADDISQLFLFRGVDLEVILMQFSTLVAAEEELEVYSQKVIKKTEAFVSIPEWDGSLNDLKIPRINFEKSPLDKLILQLPELNKSNSSFNFYATLLQLYNEADFSLKNIYPIPKKEIEKIEEIDIYFYQDKNTNPFQPIILIENPSILQELGYISENIVEPFEFPLLAKDDSYKIKSNSFSRFNFEDLADFFYSIPLLSSSDAQPNIAFVSHIQSIVLGIIKSWQYYPQIIRGENGISQFIFKANLKNESIMNSVEHLKSILPYNFYYFKQESHVLNFEGLEDLISLFLTSYINQIGKEFDVENLELGLFEQHLISGKTFFPASLEDQIFQKELSLNVSLLWQDNYEIYPEIYFDPIDEENFSATLYIGDKNNKDAGSFTLEEILSDRNHFAGLGNRQIKNILKDMLSKVENYCQGFDKLLVNPIKFTKENYYNFLLNYSVLLKYFGFSVHNADETSSLFIPVFGYIPEHLVINEEISFPEETDKSILFHEGNISYTPVVKIGKSNYVSRVEFLSIVASEKDFTLNGSRMLNTKKSIVEPILNALEEGNIEVALLDSIYCLETGNIDLFPIFNGNVIQNLINLLLSNDLNTFIQVHLDYQLGMMVSNNQNSECIHYILNLYKSIKEETNPIILICNSEAEKQDLMKKFKKDYKNLNLYHCNDLLSDIEIGKGIIIISQDDEYKDLSEILEDFQFAYLILIGSEKLAAWPVQFTNMLRNIFSFQKILICEDEPFSDLDSLYIGMELIVPNYLPSPDEFQAKYSFEINTFRNEQSLNELKKICSPFIF